MSSFASPKNADAAALGTVGIRITAVTGLTVKEAHAKIVDGDRTLAKNSDVKSVHDTLSDLQPLTFAALSSLKGPLKIEIREPGRLYGSTVASCTLPVAAVLLPFEADVELPLQPKGCLKATIFFDDRRPLYGLDLRAAAARGVANVPSVVSACCEMLDALPAPRQRGLYRVPGDGKAVDAVRAALNGARTHEDAVHVLEGADPAVIASALKLYLKELDPALLRCSSRAYAVFKAGQGVEKLRDAVRLLPPHALDTTRHLFAHLRRVADECAENKMTPGNLGVCFGPTLFRGSDELLHVDAHNAACQGLVERFHNVFAEEPPAPSSFDTHFAHIAGDGSSLDKDGFESLAYALECFPAIEQDAFADLPPRDADGRVSREECLAWWRRRGRATPPPLAEASYAMVDFYLNYDARREGVLDAAGFAGLYDGLVEAGYDLGEPETTLAAMDADGDGRVSFREFVGWFEGLCAASDEAA